MPSPFPSRFRQRLLAALLVLALGLLPPATAWSPVGEPPSGHLLIVGGGDTPAEVLARFVELAGGAEQARIAVLPMASIDGDEEVAEIVADLRALGAAAWRLDLSREEAEDEEAADRFEGITGFWFCGGDQARLAAILRGTPALAAIQKRYFAGAVVGGTSAGAAVMTTAMLTGNRQQGSEGTAMPAIARGLFEIDEGFGFLPGAIVDQHFLQRSRHNRLLSAVLERPGLLGVGIDEQTAILVRPDGRWEILGDSYVKVFDARRARIAPDGGPLTGSSDITLHLLPSRSIYDPANGTSRLPDGAGSA